MKHLNKIISFMLCLLLIIHISIISYGAGAIEDYKEIQTYNIRVVSNEYSEQFVLFYEFNEKYYLDLKDIAVFTRCTFSENEKTITLEHGMRKIILDKSTGHMTDSDIVDQGDIDLLTYDGKYLCEGIPMLIYLGATCSINENEELVILMPTFTIWESIMPDYLDYYYDIEKMYGGKDKVAVSITCAVIADLFDGVSGHGPMGLINTNLHIEDGLNEILKVDMMKYSSVQESAAAQNQKINEFLSSFVINSADKTSDFAINSLDYYYRYYLASKNGILLDKLITTNDLDEASELAMQIKDQVYAQSVKKANLKSAKKIKIGVEFGLLAVDAGITAYEMIQYDKHTKELFAKTYSQEVIDYAGLKKIRFQNVYDSISNKLKDNKSIIVNTAANKVTEYATEKVSGKGVEAALSQFTSKANIYASAIQIATFVCSLINYRTNQAFSADLNAICLSKAQKDAATLVASLLLKERDESKFSDAEKLETLRYAFMLYYRTTIAFSENISVSIKEFGTGNTEKLITWFSSTTEDSVCNYTAEYLYRITNCTIVPIVPYSELSDGVLTTEWVSNFKKDNTAYLDVLKKYEGYIKSWEERIKEYNERYEDKEYLSDERQIAITDINGDGTDELLFVANTDAQTHEGWEEYVKDLYIFTLHNGQASKILQETIYTEAAGGYRYLILKTTDNQLVVLDTGIDEFEDCSMDRYSIQGNNLNKESHHELFYNPYPYGDEPMYSINMDGEETTVTESEFESTMQSLSKDFETVLIKSGGRVDLSIYDIQDEQEAVSMTYEEAVEFLGGNTTTNEGEETIKNPDKNNPEFKSYSEVLQKLKNDYGDIDFNSYYSQDESTNFQDYYIVEACGLCYTELIDFNNDGIEELLAVAKHPEDDEYTVFIYTTEKGSIRELSASKDLICNFDYNNINGRQLVIKTISSQESYIDAGFLGDTYTCFKVYGIKNDEFKLISFSCIKDFFSENTLDWEKNYFVMDESFNYSEDFEHIDQYMVSEDEFKSKIDDWIYLYDYIDKVIPLRDVVSESELQEGDYSLIDKSLLINSLIGTEEIVGP